jgi:hypothetical protein
MANEEGNLRILSLIVKRIRKEEVGGILPIS